MRDVISGFYAGLRALRRDWRSGEIRLLLIALITAVAAVSSVAFLVDRVGQALQRDAAQMLGGDLIIESGQPVPQNFIEQAHDLHLATAKTLEFPSMVLYNGASHLVSVKAVSTEYPLRGQVSLQNDAGANAGVAASGGPEGGSVWIDPQLPGLLQMPALAQIELGDSAFRTAGIIAHEPDRSMRFVNVAPRVLMALSDVDQTGLVGPGSRVTYRLLVAGAPSALEQYQAWLDDHLDANQRITTLEDSGPEFLRALDRANQFLTLIALLTVMLAGVAVALTARRFCIRHQDGIAIMRCLGASTRILGWMIWVEFIALAIIASLVGLALGYTIHTGLVIMVMSLLDISLPHSSWVPYAKAMATGSLILLGFAVPPLLALRRVPPIRVLRRDATGLAAHNRTAYVTGLVAFALLALGLTGDWRLGGIIVGGFAVSLIGFALTAIALVWAVGRLRHHVGNRPLLRFALAGMSRRRALAVTQLCALAMGLSILLLLTITRTDLLEGWKNTIPPDAPNTFLINIQPDQRDTVTALLSDSGLGTADLVPMVRARLTGINGVPVTADMYDSERAQSMVNREFNLSHRLTLPDSNIQAEGRWLRADQNEASLELGLASTLGIDVGDTLTFDFAGQRRDVRVVGLREVKWDSFDVNFFALLSESVLRDAPASYITSVHFPDDSVQLTRTLLEAFPNMTVFDIRAILAQVQGVLDHVITVIQFLFLFTIAAGMVVLAAALFATRDERMYEVALLRALGASGAQLSGALRIELILLGGLAGLLAAATAQLIALALATWVFKFDLSASWWPWFAGLVAGVLLALFSGRLALMGVLNVSPLVSLRATQ